MNTPNTATHADILKKVTIAPQNAGNPRLGVAPSLPIWSACYRLTLKRYDEKSNTLIVPFYQVERLPQCHREQSGFIVWVSARYKLSAKITAPRLAEIMQKAHFFTSCHIDAREALEIAASCSWLGEAKAALIDGDTVKIWDVIQRATGAELCLKNGALIGVNYRMRELCGSIHDVLTQCAINPREYKSKIESLIDYAHRLTLAGYSVRRVDDADEITRIYARRNDNFSSCMRGYDTPARVYQPYTYKDGERPQSVALHILEKNGEFIARFIVRLKSNKYPSLYTNEATETTEHILSALGYTRSCSCMVGARLPLVTDHANHVFMPYIDGDCKEIRIIDDEADTFYLQVGGTRGVHIGEGNATNGFLKVNEEGRAKGFNSCAGHDHDDEDGYMCEHCGDHIHEGDQFVSEHGTVYCETCYSDNYTTCDECEGETWRDDSIYMDAVYIPRTGRTTSMCVCPSCADDFWQSPTDETYFYINDIR